MVYALNLLGLAFFHGALRDNSELRSGRQLVLGHDHVWKKTLMSKPELQVLVARYAYENLQELEKCPECLLPTNEEKAALQKAYRKQQLRNRRNPFLNSTSRKRKRSSRSYDTGKDNIG